MEMKVLMVSMVKKGLFGTCILSFFLISFLIGGKLLYNILLVSAIQQCGPVIIKYVFISFPLLAPL